MSCIVDFCSFPSLFVLLKGATKEDAFKIGMEIVDTVTAANPKPVKLKFEKVYSLSKYGYTFQVKLRKFSFFIISRRCICLASFKPRKGMLGTCTRHWIKRSQFLTPKVSKL